MTIKDDDLRLNGITAFLYLHEKVVNGNFLEREIDTITNAIEHYENSNYSILYQPLLNDMKNAIELKKKEIGKTR